MFYCLRAPSRVTSDCLSVPSIATKLRQYLNFICPLPRGVARIFARGVQVQLPLPSSPLSSSSLLPLPSPLPPSLPLPPLSSSPQIQLDGLGSAVDSLIRPQMYFDAFIALKTHAVATFPHWGEGVQPKNPLNTFLLDFID